MPQISEGLEYEDQIPGEGDEAAPGQTVEVHYTGWLTESFACPCNLKHQASLQCITILI